MDWNEFQFALSNEKFKEREIDNTVYTASLIAENSYLVRYNTVDGWEGREYSRTDVETNVKEGFWVVIK